MQLRTFLFTLLLLVSPIVLSENFSLSVSGELPKDVRQNVISLLGELPANSDAEPAFIFSAKKKTLEALNALGYYRSEVNSKVTTSAQNSTQLTLSIELNQPTVIKRLDVTLLGDALHDDTFTQLLSRIGIKQGDKLHHGTYQKFKEDLIALGLERGYFDSKFLKANIELNENLETADIIIIFDSGNRYQFGEVSFNQTGQVNINADILAAASPFAKGDYYQRHLLQQFQNELDNTQYFSNVLLKPEVDIVKQNNTLPIDVSLAPAKRHQFDLGLGYATDTRENLSIGWKTPVINRFGHKQETKISYSKINPTGYFIYSIPLSHPNNDIMQLKSALEEDDFADLTSRFLTFQVGRVYSENNMLRQPYIRLLSEQWTAVTTDYDTNYFIPGFTWSNKKWQGSALDPSGGFRQFYNIEGAFDKLASETSFLRVNAYWKYISLFSEKHRFVTRAEVGYVLAKDDVGGELSPSLRFYAGGDQSIRGFAYQSVGPEIAIDETNSLVSGGTNMLVGSAEYQYYFSNTWRGIVFSDAGSVNNTDKLNLVYSVGTGLHYLSAVGPIRFAVGYPISEDDPSWRIHFSIGAEL